MEEAVEGGPCHGFLWLRDVPADAPYFFAGFAIAAGSPPGAFFATAV